MMGSVPKLEMGRLGAGKGSRHVRSWEPLFYYIYGYLRDY